VTDKWRKWPGIAAMFFILVVSGARAGVPIAEDLREAGRLAEQRCAPVLLEFAAEYCDYCVLLENEVLGPTLLDPDYNQRVLMQKLLIDGDGTLTGFDSRTIDAADIAEQYRVWVTPTVLFVDRQGKEIAERLVGISSVDYYGGYLDAALEKSRKRLRELGRCDDNTTARNTSDTVSNPSPDFR